MCACLCVLWLRYLSEAGTSQLCVLSEIYLQLWRLGRSMSTEILPTTSKTLVPPKKTVQSHLSRTTILTQVVVRVIYLFETVGILLLRSVFFGRDVTREAPTEQVDAGSSSGQPRSPALSFGILCVATWYVSLCIYDSVAINRPAMFRRLQVVETCCSTTCGCAPFLMLR